MCRLAKRSALRSVTTCAAHSLAAFALVVTACSPTEQDPCKGTENGISCIDSFFGTEIYGIGPCRDSQRHGLWIRFEDSKPTTVYLYDKGELVHKAPWDSTYQPYFALIEDKGEMTPEGVDALATKFFEDYKRRQRGEGPLSDKEREKLAELLESDAHSCEEGQRQREQTSEDGTKAKWCEVIKDGEAVREGLYMAWYKNGVTALKGQYRAGRKNGLWQRWHDNGELAEESEFQGGVLHGRSQAWDENGKPLYDRTYWNGKPTK